MRVQLIGKQYLHPTGMSRYSEGLRDGLREAGLDVMFTRPASMPIPAGMQAVLKRLGVDAGAFLTSYPLHARLVGSDIYHLTDQALATLLLFQRFPKPVVVTVLDIIPYIVRDVPHLNTFRHRLDYWFYGLAVRGLERADALIAISRYTKQTLIHVLGLPEDRISVIYPAVDHTKYRPTDVPSSFYSRYGLNRDTSYVLFVGSEDPRKNLETAVRAFARVRQERTAAKLLKVGAPQFEMGRERIRRLIKSLRLEDDVVFLDVVPEHDLPLLYNASDVCVLPSLYEGFGLPMVEAMACGTPVICSRTGPLPEVVGDGGLQIDPFDVEAFAEAILTVLHSGEERTRLREAGQAQAARFTWEGMARETHQLYAALTR